MSKQIRSTSAQTSKQLSKQTLLKVKNLTLAYGTSTVINSASFEIKSGDFVCLVGANGSGKSTLVKGILGLKKPLCGEVVMGEGLSRTKIGYLPQESKIDQNFPASVKEIVLSGALGRMGFSTFYKSPEKKCLKECLKLLKITNLETESFASLSGGQKQKVLLARALMATSRLLILDEPSNNLDFPSRKEFYHLLKSLNREQGMTIIMITHDLDADDLIGNKVLAISGGKVTMQATNAYLGSFK